MPHDITGHIERKYTSAAGEDVEITHVVVTYYKGKTDIKHIKVLPIELANNFANQRGIRGAFVSAMIDKKEAIANGYIK